MRQLEIYFNDTPAGILTEHKPGKGYTFTYYKEYLSSNLPSISLTLRKQSEPFYSDYLFPFFTNMLPEGGNRRVICRYHKIDENDSFSLLDAMAGADFIGAVNVRKLRHDRD